VHAGKGREERAEEGGKDGTGMSSLRLGRWSLTRLSVGRRRRGLQKKEEDEEEVAANEEAPEGEEQMEDDAPFMEARDVSSGAMVRWDETLPKDDVELQRAWQRALRAFALARNANGQSVDGLFDENIAAHVQFCNKISLFLEMRALEEIEEADLHWEDVVLKLGLEVARMLLAHRGAASDVLRREVALSAFSVFAMTRLGTAIGLEALNCLNNALYDNAPAQLNYTKVPKEEGFGAIVANLEQIEDIQSFHRAAVVALYMVAGNQETQDMNFTPQCFEACLRGLVMLGCTFPSHPNGRKDDMDFFGGDEAESKMKRDAMLRAMKFLHAAATLQPSVLENVVQESHKNLLELAEERGVENPLDLLKDATLDDESISYLDRLGILLMAIMRVPIPEEEIIMDQVDELKIEAVNLVAFASEIPGFPELFNARGALDGMLDFLETRVSEMLKKPTQEAASEFEEIIPVVVAGTRFSTLSDDARKKVKSRVFPREEPEIKPRKGMSKKEAERLLKERRISGSTPPDVLGGKLIQVLNSLENPSRKQAGEFLYTLCNKDPTEFNRRCGVNNAASILSDSEEFGAALEHLEN